MHGETIFDVLGADDAMNAWFVFMAIPLAVGALILHRYGVQRVLICIAFGWFGLGALLLGYSGGRL